MLGECDVCGEPVRIGGVGRPARFCGSICRKRAFRRREIPGELRARDRWVRWRLIDRGGRLTKLPVMVSGRVASSTDPSTWTDFASARRSRVGDGFGFVLGDGVGCVDLDGCLDGRGRVAGWAQVVLDRCVGSFVEVSQSGRGLHVFGLLPEGPGRVCGGVEVYSVGRFIAMTGRRWSGSSGVLVDLSGVLSLLAR